MDKNVPESSRVVFLITGVLGAIMSSHLFLDTIVPHIILFVMMSHAYGRSYESFQTAWRDRHESE